MRRFKIAAVLTVLAAAVTLPATAASASPVQAVHTGNRTAGMAVPDNRLAGNDNILEYWGLGEGIQFKNFHTGACLDDSIQFGLRTYVCTFNSYFGGWQDWVVSKTTADSVWGQLKNKATGRCLDFSAQYGLRAITCSDYGFGVGYQAWEAWDGPAGGYHILQSDGSSISTCLDDSSAGVRGWPCSGLSQVNGYQSWEYLYVT